MAKTAIPPEQGRKDLELARALASEDGQKILETIERSIANSLTTILNPSSKDAEVLQARARIMGLLDIVDEWGDAVTLGRTVARQAVRERIVRKVDDDDRGSE